MAKYDTVKMTYEPKEGVGTASIEIVVLFEDGDNVDTVINSLRDKIQARIVNLQALSALK